MTDRARLRELVEQRMATARENVVKATDVELSYVAESSRGMEAAYRDVLSLLADTPEPAETGSGWQPIETAPTDGTEVLLCIAGEHEPHLYHAEWRDDQWCIEWTDGTNPIYGATHWQPLPDPPATKGAKKR